jgi:hypothetical protein
MSPEPYQAHLERRYVIMNKKDMYKHLLYTTELTKKKRERKDSRKQATAGERNKRTTLT